MAWYGNRRSGQPRPGARAVVVGLGIAMVIPGSNAMAMFVGSLVAGAAALDLARSVSRRAERHAWELHETDGGVSESVLLFLNRISDLLWIMARVESTPNDASNRTPKSP